MSLEKALLLIIAVAGAMGQQYVFHPQSSPYTYNIPSPLTTSPETSAPALDSNHSTPYPNYSTPSNPPQPSTYFYPPPNFQSPQVFYNPEQSNYSAPPQYPPQYQQPSGYPYPPYPSYPGQPPYVAPQSFGPYPAPPTQQSPPYSGYPNPQGTVNYSAPYPYPSYSSQPLPAYLTVPPQTPSYPPQPYPAQSYVPPPPYGPQAYAPQSFVPPATYPPYAPPPTPYYNAPYPGPLPYPNYSSPVPSYLPGPVFYGTPVPKPEEALTPVSAPAQTPFHPPQSPEGNKPHYRILGTPSNLFLAVNNNSSVPAYSGLIIDLLNALSNTVGFTYSFGVQPDQQYGSQTADGSWNGLIRSLLDGKADVAAADLSITSDRESAVDFTLPFYQYTLGMIVNKQYANGNGNGLSYLIRNNADAQFLKSSTSVRDRAIWENITKNYPDSFVESDNEGIQKVLSGPFALILESPGISYALTTSNGQIERSPAVFATASLGFAVPHGSPIREKLSWGILRLQESGQLQTILAKYMPSQGNTI